MSVGEFLKATLRIDQYASWKEAGEESRAAWKGGYRPPRGAAAPPNPPAFLGGLRPPNPPEGHPYLQIAPEARHPYGALDRLI